MLEMSGENPKEKKTRRKFEPEFKNNAVRLVELGSQSIKEVATELDMSEATLLNWVKSARKTKNIKAINNPDIIEEIRRLRKENERLRMEKEILKRFSAFWVKETSER